LLGDERVNAVRARRIHLGQPDETGRQVPQIIDGSDFDIDADLVVKALGFDPEDLPRLFEQKDLGVSRWGTVQIDWKTMMTQIPGVFAAGDIVRGASLVVWGIRDGRDAAEQIDAFIEAELCGETRQVG
jgi:glutamate synthase (NADPH/NADH) small chain